MILILQILIYLILFTATIKAVVWYDPVSHLCVEDGKIRIERYVTI